MADTSKISIELDSPSSPPESEKLLQQEESQTFVPYEYPTDPLAQDRHHFYTSSPTSSRPGYFRPLTLILLTILAIFLISCMTLITIVYITSYPSELSIPPQNVPICRGNGDIQATIPKPFFPTNSSTSKSSLLLQALAIESGNYIINDPRPEILQQDYEISMVHQLHCLAMVREALGILGTPIATADERPSHHHDHREAGEDSHQDGVVGELKMRKKRRHLSHCLDYIAQGILCAADPTVEPTTWERLPSGKMAHLVTSEDVVHECRDFGGMVTVEV